MVGFYILSFITTINVHEVQNDKSLKAAAFGTSFAHTLRDQRLGTQTEILN